MAKKKNKADKQSDEPKKVEETPEIKSNPVEQPKEEKGAVVEISRKGVAIFPSGRHPRDLRKSNEPEPVIPQPKDGVLGTR